jgi:hypothetical protein
MFFKRDSVMWFLAHNWFALFFFGERVDGRGQGEEKGEIMDGNLIYRDGGKSTQRQTTVHVWTLCE